MCDRDGLREVSLKLDHIMYVQCEMFAMMKITNNSDHKLDKCIALLQKISSNISSIHAPVSTSNSTYQPKSKTTVEKNVTPSISLQDELLKELKEKLRKREENKLEQDNKLNDDKVKIEGKGGKGGKGPPFRGKGKGKGKGV